MTDLNVYRGDSFAKTLTFTDGDGASVDITGATVYFSIKETSAASDADALIQKKGTIDDGTGGIASVSLTAAEMDVVPVGSWFYDFQITLANGAVLTVLAGDFLVTQDITQKTS